MGQQKRTSMHNPTVSAVAPAGVPRTYLISRGFAAYSVGFCLVWFGAIVGFVVIGQMPHEPTLANIGAMLAALLLASAPAFLGMVLISYRVTLSDDGVCAFRTVRRVSFPPVEIPFEHVPQQRRASPLWI